ncbi:MAG: hypothetical protein R6V53_01695 [Candidatus Woesearchaeota archaeon]
MAGCVTEKTDDSDETIGVKDIVLGYCPTMANIAGDIAENNSHVSLKGYASTSSAISALNAGEVDVILVGRIAKSYETDAYEKRLRDGLTLVGNEKRFISMEELAGSTVHTAASEVRQYLPEETNVVYHDSVDAAIDAGLDELVLISWEDYADEMELVIPVQGRSKIPEFRIPVLYSHDEVEKVFEGSFR